MAQYKFFNGPAPTTSARAALATGTGLLTHLQIKGITGIVFRVVEWGVSFDGSAVATPVKAELIETGTINATVTALANGDIAKYDHPSNPNPDQYFSLGVSATGYNASGEGTITTTRTFDAQFIAPTNQYAYQFPLGVQPMIAADSILRVRIHAGASVNAFVWVTVEV